MKVEPIEVEVKTKGFEEATEKIEALADAYDGLPPQIMIKGARDCVFNIYPTQDFSKDYHYDVKEEE